MCQSLKWNIAYYSRKRELREGGAPKENGGGNEGGEEIKEQRENFFKEIDRTFECLNN